MRKKIIGIVPQIKNSKNNNPYEDCYTYIYNYSERIKENNTIPIGLFVDNEINKDLLDLCDGFLFPGGNKICRFHFQIIEYAIKNNKPILGICLGMQAMAVYSYLIDQLNEKKMNNDINNIWGLYNSLKKEGVMFLKKIDIPNNHGYQIMQEEIDINIDNIMKQAHIVKFNDNSILKRIYNNDELSVISLHSYSVNVCGSIFIPTSYSGDGIIESLEYKNKNNFIIGVQWHPELENNNILFKEFIEHC